jgi:hypothetical protein
MVISIPAIAPGHGNNPAIKMIFYNQNSFALDDFTTFYMPYWNPDGGGTLKAWNKSSVAGTLLRKDSLSLIQFFQKMHIEHKSEDIKQFVTKIYSVSGQRTDTSAIDAAIYLDYRITK